ncbi:MAG: U32 family peptidase [Desulfobulbaceae bacterium]|nr:U32 family peptidase [Desulfobulbaceae bacterium]
MNKKAPHIPELLAPAGNFEKLTIAIHYGADAVYLGGSHYSLRAHATFPEDELERAVAYAHDRSVKVYATLNILAHRDDFKGLDSYLQSLADFKVDGLIISDPGVLDTAKKIVPNLPVHLSTQANVTNLASARFWEKQGIKRLNLARELSLEEIRTIKKGIAAEVEIFVHGALCISYSGRCLLSSYLTGRDANQGNCAHPCRYSYALMEEKRPGQFFPMEEDDRGAYIMNSKDLCLLKQLPSLIGSGVDSLKIEGRMKSPYYVGGVVRVYRATLDFLAGHTNFDTLDQPGPLPAAFPDAFMAELSKLGSRGYTENFINGPPNDSDMLYESPRIVQNTIPIGIVRQIDPEPLIDVRNPITPGTHFEYLHQGLETTAYTIDAIHDQDGTPLDRANPGNLVMLKTTPPVHNWKTNSLLRSDI